ncbi:MAG: diguanylate cyclase [Gammaproteobacteria bacterium]|nr:diguanylate cyclase [Gammaproteobacteria bacterium]
MAIVPKPRILAVDDSRVMRVAMKKILGHHYDVIEAEHGEDAWTLLLNDSDIQVVFTDLSMPYLDGFGLLDRMRQSEDDRLREMPVIIVTGNEDDDESKQRALDRGASDFISKPFESVHLLARAKAHVRLQQKSSQLIDIAGKMEKQAAVDELTGLGGQRYFCKVADETIAYLRRHGGQLVIVRMDIDDFNLIFIKHGKAVADVILKTIGAHLIKQVRKEDMLARIGLAKFAMLVRDTPLSTAEQLADRMRRVIANLQFNVGQHEKIRVTASVCLMEPLLKENEDIRLLIHQLDKRVTDISIAGGNTTVVYAAQPMSDPELINLETALNYLKHGEAARLHTLTYPLIARLLPLLSYLGEQLGDDIQVLVEKLKSHYKN